MKLAGTVQCIGLEEYISVEKCHEVGRNRSFWKENRKRSVHPWLDQTSGKTAINFCNACSHGLECVILGCEGLREGPSNPYCVGHDPAKRFAYDQKKAAVKTFLRAEMDRLFGGSGSSSAAEIRTQRFLDEVVSGRKETTWAEQERLDACGMGGMADLLRPFTSAEKERSGGVKGLAMTSSGCRHGVPGGKNGACGKCNREAEEKLQFTLWKGGENVPKRQVDPLEEALNILVDNSQPIRYKDREYRIIRQPFNWIEPVQQRKLVDDSHLVSLGSHHLFFVFQDLYRGLDFADWWQENATNYDKQQILEQACELCGIEEVDEVVYRVIDSAQEVEEAASEEPEEVVSVDTAFLTSFSLKPELGLGEGINDDVRLEDELDDGFHEIESAEIGDEESDEAGGVVDDDKFKNGEGKVVGRKPFPRVVVGFDEFQQRLLLKEKGVPEFKEVGQAGLGQVAAVAGGGVVNLEPPAENVSIRKHVDKGGEKEMQWVDLYKKLYGIAHDIEQSAIKISGLKVWVGMSRFLEDNNACPTLCRDWQGRGLVVPIGAKQTTKIFLLRLFEEDIDRDQLFQAWNRITDQERRELLKKAALACDLPTEGLKVLQAESSQPKKEVRPKEFVVKSGAVSPRVNVQGNGLRSHLLQVLLDDSGVREALEEAVARAAQGKRPTASTFIELLMARQEILRKSGKEYLLKETNLDELLDGALGK